jgi:hypothetical protein
MSFFLVPNLVSRCQYLGLEKKKKGIIQSQYCASTSAHLASTAVKMKKWPDISPPAGEGPCCLGPAAVLVSASAVCPAQTEKTNISVGRRTGAFQVIKVHLLAFNLFSSW